jgi:2-iminoacetate synthase ThiH
MSMGSSEIEASRRMMLMKQAKRASVNGTANIKVANVCVRGHGYCNFVTRIRWVVVAH